MTTHRLHRTVTLLLVAAALLPLSALRAAEPAAKAAKGAKAEPTAPVPLPPPALPVAMYLTWQHDPVTTMTVHWHTDWTEGFTDSVLEYRAAGNANGAWSRATGGAAQMPFTNRMVHTVEITGLRGDTLHEFRLGRLVTREPDGTLLFTPHGPVQKFRTLPATLSRPVRFVSGGDVYGGSTPDLMATMCRVAAAQEPEFALDSFHSNPVPGPQTDWLRGTLAKRRIVPFIVPFYHVPAYPSNRAMSGAVSVAIRANWVPLFDEAGVRFAFENHDHTYKVTHPLRAGEKHPDGTRYLGDGAWAVTTRVTHPLEQAPYLERAHSKNHVFVVTLGPGKADFIAVDAAGAEFDRFSIPARR